MSFHSEDMADFLVTALSCMVTVTFDLSTSKLVTGDPCHGLPSCKFSASNGLPFST